MIRERTLHSFLLFTLLAAVPSRAFLCPRSKRLQLIELPGPRTVGLVAWREHVVLGNGASVFVRRHHTPRPLDALSDSYLENDLVAIQRPGSTNSRLCAVRPDQSVVPLCRKEDDVATDLYADPREYATAYWLDPIDDHVIKSYGEAYYGQRPVPSLGGGIGYGAEADDVWSVDEELLQLVEHDHVELPILDVGIAHGEKARGGAL